MSGMPGSTKVVTSLFNYCWMYFFPGRRQQKERLDTLGNINHAERCFPRTEQSEALYRGLYRYAGVSDSQPLWVVRELRSYPGLNGQDLKHPGANAFMQNAWLLEHYDIGRRIVLKREKCGKNKTVAFAFSSSGCIFVRSRHFHLHDSSATSTPVKMVSGSISAIGCLPRSGKMSFSNASIRSSA